MTKHFELKTFMRGEDAPKLDGKPAYCLLANDQPLLLNRELPTTVLVSDITGAPIGYVAKEHAPQVAERLAKGEVLLAKMAGQCLCIYRQLYIWSEGEEIRSIEEGQSIKMRHRIPEEVQ